MSASGTLTVVHLEGSAVADDDLAALADLPALGGLHLRDASVSDRAPLVIQCFSQLRQLDLSQTGLREVSLSDLRYLEDLNLSGCRLEQLELANLPSLQSLNLGYTNVNDETLRGLISITSLKRLDLRNTYVTNRGLEHLSVLPKITTIYVYSTAINKDGVQSIQRSVPCCQIIGAR